MDLWNLGAQDAMTQIATNDHNKALGENEKEQEKNNRVVIAELHMGVTLSSPANLLLVFVFNPLRCPVCSQVENIYEPQEHPSLIEIGN